MSDGGKLRIGVEGARELEIEVDDIEAATAALEKGVSDGSLVWLVDSKGDRHGVVAGRLAFVEVERESGRSVSVSSSGSLTLRFLAAATTLGEPTLAETTTLFFGVATPDTGLLVGFEGVLEAFLAD